jgi:hypothetical protein
MGYVICNSVGKCEECPNCGASKPHYRNSCEPCPFVRDAKCIPIEEYNKEIIKQKGGSVMF